MIAEINRIQKRRPPVIDERYDTPMNEYPQTITLPDAQIDGIEFTDRKMRCYPAARQSFWRRLLAKFSQSR